MLERDCQRDNRLFPASQSISYRVNHCTLSRRFDLYSTTVLVFLGVLSSRRIPACNIKYAEKTLEVSEVSERVEELPNASRHKGIDKLS